MGEFEDLPEEEKERFVSFAPEAFVKFGEGAKLHDDMWVSLSPQAQAKIVFNALSHKQQVLLINGLLQGLVHIVIEEVEDMSPRLKEYVRELVLMLLPQAEVVDESDIN
jgi:hypothetical protein